MACRGALTLPLMRAMSQSQKFPAMPPSCTLCQHTWPVALVSAALRAMWACLHPWAWGAPSIVGAQVTCRGSSQSPDPWWCPFDRRGQHPGRGEASSLSAGLVFGQERPEGHSFGFKGWWLCSVGSVPPTGAGASDSPGPGALGMGRAHFKVSYLE